MSTGRRYGRWAGNPRGTPEDKTRCVEAVWEQWNDRQCSRKRGYGPDGKYCRQHGARADRRAEEQARRESGDWKA